MSEETFANALENRILLFDGAMGTEIQRYDPKSEDFPDGKDGFNDGLSITKPDWIKEIHRKYLRAGADCIETNTFGSNKIKLDEYGFGSQTVELNQKNAELARSVCDEFTDRQRFVVGSMGPTGYLPSSNDVDLGQMPLSEIRESFELQAEGLILGGVDALLIETSQDILGVKLAVEASHAAMEKTGKKVTLISNVTLDQYGKKLLGTNVQSEYTTITEIGIDIIEAGFPVASKGDFEAVSEVSKILKKSIPCGLSRHIKKDIDACNEGLKSSKRFRIHTFISTITLHMNHKLNTISEDVLQAITENITNARQYTE